MARRKRYGAEFKRQAQKRADEPGISDALVCEELGVSTRQLRRWREAIREHGEEDAFPGQGKSRDEELTRLKRKLKKAEQELDFYEKRRGTFPWTLNSRDHECLYIESCSRNTLSTNKV